MLTAYLKRQWKLLLLLAGAVAVFAAVFALYSLPVEAVAYAGLLCLMLGLVLFALEMCIRDRPGAPYPARWSQRRQRRAGYQTSPPAPLSPVPGPGRWTRAPGRALHPRGR